MRHSKPRIGREPLGFVNDHANSPVGGPRSGCAAWAEQPKPDTRISTTKTGESSAASPIYMVLGQMLSIAVCDSRLSKPWGINIA